MQRPIFARSSTRQACRLPWRAGLVAILLGSAVSFSAQANPPSVAVTTVPARMGALPDQIIGYGVATPTADTVQTLSVQLDGRVASLPVTPNQHVVAGQILASVTPAPSAVSAWLQAQSALRLALAQRRSTADLLAHHLATTDQLDQADRAAADARAARDALAVEGAGQSRIDLRAPFEGDIAQIAVSAGDRIAAGTALMQLARTKGALLEIGVSPVEASRFAAGMSARLEPLEAGAAIPATVLRVGVGIDAKTRLAPVTLMAEGRLAPNAAYRARVTVGQWQGWIVPHQAVIRADDGSHHLFQLAGTSARQVAVSVLGTDADPDAAGQDVVAGSLDPALPVIVDGAAQLDDGMRVRLGAAE